MARLPALVCAIAGVADAFMEQRTRRCPRTALSSTPEELLAAAAGAGRGMAAKRRGPKKNKYARTEEKLDPWAATVKRADEAAEAKRRQHLPPDYALKGDCFVAGAKAARGSKVRRAPVLDFDARDPTTFGFEELGVVVGAHGLRGALRVPGGAVDASGAAAEELLRPGLGYLRLATRRSPRPVVVEDARFVRRHGTTTRFQLTLRALTSRDDARRLAGATLYAHASEEALGFAPRPALAGLPVVDASGAEVGAVFDVLDPNEGEVRAGVAFDARRGATAGPQALAPPLLEVDLGGDRHVLVPYCEAYAAPQGDRVRLTGAAAGLLGLAFDYAPPKPVLKGLLPPPADWRPGE